MRELRKYLSLFLFTTLMLVKVSAFHVYTHDHGEEDHVEDCPICDVLFEALSSAHDFELGFDFELPQDTLVAYHANTTYSYAYFTSEISFHFFGRPPPNLV